MHLKKWILGLTIVSTVLALTHLPKANSEPDEHVIKIIAQRFHYTPSEITLKRGKPVVLEFTSLDFIHGFSIPDLKLRADLPPGKVTRVRLTPEKTGSYDFLCDNFCGTGHEDMHGKIVVTD